MYVPHIALYTCTCQANDRVPPPREEDPYLRQLGEEFDPNESSLLAELHMATSDSVPGVEQIILENQQLNTDKLALAAVVCVCVCMCVCVCACVCVCVLFRIHLSPRSQE